MHHDPVDILEHAGLRPTPNRVLVVRALQKSGSPMSLIELEHTLQTLDRSSISRVLSSLLENNVVHSMEDGRGVSKYEICNGCHNGIDDDMHAHFYCEKCDRVYCFEHLATPRPEIPKEFQVNSINFMIKGVCPSCTRKM